MGRKFLIETKMLNPESILKNKCNFITGKNTDNYLLEMRVRSFQTIKEPSVLPSKNALSTGEGLIKGISWCWMQSCTCARSHILRMINYKTANCIIVLIS